MAGVAERAKREIEKRGAAPGSARERAYVGGVFAHIEQEQQRKNGATQLHRKGREKAREIGTVQEIPLSEIHTGLNPREHFDATKIEELAASIKEHGLVQPITVRRHNGGYQLIAGERRYRAIHALGRSSVPAIVRDVDDREAAELALIENVNREDMRPSETGRAYVALVERGMSTGELARRTGKSAAYIHEHMALVQKLPPHLQALVDKGKLKMGLVAKLAKLSPAAQEEAAERILSKDMGERTATRTIEALHARENQLTMFGNPELSKRSTQAHEQYQHGVDTATSVLSRLDDDTMKAAAHAIDAPHKELERINLMIKQLQRMRKILEQAAAARETGAGI